MGTARGLEDKRPVGHEARLYVAARIPAPVVLGIECELPEGARSEVQFVEVVVVVRHVVAHREHYAARVQRKRRIAHNPVRAIDKHLVRDGSVRIYRGQAELALPAIIRDPPPFLERPVGQIVCRVKYGIA